MPRMTCLPVMSFLLLRLKHVSVAKKSGTASMPGMVSKRDFLVAYRVTKFWNGNQAGSIAAEN